MVEVRQVTKRYGAKTVLDNVSLTIEKGALTSLIGPNGAGKSTLLSIIGRLIPADGGEIYIDGKPLPAYGSNELARKLSFLRQSNHVNLRLTVRELVSFGRFPYSQGRLTAADWEVVDRAIESMELGELQHKYLDQLSGGQRQRAFIAMVVAQDTDYIMLDEPLNNLDMKHSVQIMKLLRRLVEESGKGVVVVMHDINFASHYSDHVVAFREGCILYDGKTDDIIEPSVLQEVFGMEIQIGRVCDRRVCVYFT
ncbi:MAG: ATP-binding cassette domain-containing protein [Clostridia bacterium]|nr:iron ABC transporter ATP-binding protein [Bacillota bacterium]MBO2521945.1 iron ABC transporter ATP-binding protein [Bacillota bacterium]